jgi:hypothetical protein
MKTLIIVSKCLKESKINPEESLYEFHFKGVCSGAALKKVILRARHDFCLIPGEEYLMYVAPISMKGGTLKGLVIKSRRLDECWDKS